MSAEKAHKALKRLVRRQMQVACRAGVVSAVDTDAWTCDVDPVDGGPTLFDVRLKVSQGGDDAGVYAVPSVGSRILAIMLDGDQNNWAVVNAEHVKEYIIKADGGAEIRVSPGGMVTIAGEAYGGLVKVQQLRSELTKVNAFLNGIRSAIQNAPVVSGDGGASFKASLIVQLSALQLPTYSDIESDKVKHGGL